MPTNSADSKELLIPLPQSRRKDQPLKLGSYIGMRDDKLHPLFLQRRHRRNFNRIRFARVTHRNAHCLFGHNDRNQSQPNLHDGFEWLSRRPLTRNFLRGFRQACGARCAVVKLQVHPSIDMKIGTHNPPLPSPRQRPSRTAIHGEPSTVRPRLFSVLKSFGS